MKKILLAILVVALAVSCFAMVFTANAATDIAVSNTPSERGYFKYENKTLEDFEAGISGVSAVYAANTNTWVTDDDGNHAVLTVQGGAERGYAGQEFSIGVPSAVGTYFVEFDIKPIKNVTAATVFFGVAGSSTCFAQIGMQFNADLSNITIVDGSVAGGWPATNYKNAAVTALDNGYWHVYFEYDVTADMSSGTHLIFCQNSNVATDDNAIQWDNISYGDLENAVSYYNVDWNVDYGTLTNVWSEQPIWANKGTVEADYFGTGVSALKIFTANKSGEVIDTSNTQIGGIVNTAGNDKKIAKNPVMTYYQFDIDLEGISMFNIWTLEYYTAVIYQNNGWRSEGGVLNLKSVPLNKGYRISYFIDMGATDAANMEFNINTTGNGAAYFANLVVAQIDNVRAPWVSSETVTYNKVTPHDVTVNLDTKGREITGLTCGGEAVAAANYTYVGETLTLKAAAFDGKSGDLTFKATTAGGEAEFAVMQEQTQTPVTASLVSADPINKFYDGTTDVKENIALTLSGVEDGHNVDVSYTAVYDSANAGSGRKITLTLSLTGTHAYLYELTNETLEIADCEIYALIYLPITYAGDPIVKYEDGTKNVVGDINLTLDGVEQGDVVSITFDAEYDSALVGTRQILITNITLTGKDAYKYALVSTSSQIDGEIIARTETSVYYDGVIEKRFDGTTYLSTNGIELSLRNIDADDQVSVTFRAYFTNVDAGESTVKIVDIELTGKDAYKYILTSNHLDVDGYIIPMKNVALSDDKGYYTMDGQTLQTYDFENAAIGNISVNTINGLYVAPANGEISNGITQTASVVDDNGNKVLKIEENCFAYSTQLLSTNATGGYRDQGIYAVAFKVKPLNASIIGVLIRNGYDTNDKDSILADYRYAITNDVTGKAISATKETQGFLGANQKYSNGHANVDADGWIDCYFEYELPSGIAYGDEFCPVVIFTGASVTNKSDSTYYFDDIKYICKSNSNKYMTVDHNFDMEGVDGEEAANTPFYSALSNGFVYDTTWIENDVENKTVIRLDIPANNSDQVGAFKNSTSEGALKLLKGKGLHYVQFDFDTTCNSFNLFALGYFDIQCVVNATTGYEFKLEVYKPSISNFTTQIAENGMTRISFLLDMTGLPYNEFYLNLKATTGMNGGEIYFDNLFVSHEDYTPIAADAKYNFVGTEDVVFSADLKGARLLGLELDGVAVAADKFTYDAEADAITLDKSLFETTNPNAAARVLTIKTSAGDINVSASIVDNRPQVTLTLDYTGEAIAKDYDGTTDVEQSVIDAIVAQIVMGGVTEGDDVTLTCDVAYSSKNAGEVTIVIGNIVLSGEDAVKYTLATKSLSVNATINKIQLTVAGTTAANKEYDGTTGATATVGNLSGVVAGDEVTLSIASAIFNSKNVADANKVTVTYALSGADAANYIVPASHDISNVSIGKKTVTVTADAKTITLGENDPELTYSVTGLITGETLSGALTRAEGIEAGEYDILQGTLSGGNNYQINYVGAKLTIVEASTGEPTDPEGLPAGAIAGIVVGSVAVAGGAGFAVWFILRKKRLAK